MIEVINSPLFNIAIASLLILIAVPLAGVWVGVATPESDHEVYESVVSGCSVLAINILNCVIGNFVSDAYPYLEFVFKYAGAIACGIGGGLLVYAFVAKAKHDVQK